MDLVTILNTFVMLILDEEKDIEGKEGAKVVSQLNGKSNDKKDSISKNEDSGGASVSY